LKYSEINEAPRPYVYVPFLQSYRPSMILHTRGSGPIEALIDRARAHVVKLDADLPIIYAKSLAGQTRAALIIFEFMSATLFVFGVAGMSLAGMGIFGLVSYTVKQSTHEIGIRLALGASAVSVVREFLGRGLRLGAVGAGLGLAAALAVSRLL